MVKTEAHMRALKVKLEELMNAGFSGMHGDLMNFLNYYLEE